MRIASYLFALGASTLIVAGIWWAVETEARGNSHHLQHIDGQRFNTLMPSDHGVLEQCVVCHRLTPGAPEHSAPALWNIVGAPKAGARWFGYSPALAEASGEWNTTDLDRYLEDPVTFLPGTTKTLSPIRDAGQRRDIIAALEQLTR